MSKENDSLFNSLKAIMSDGMKTAQVAEPAQPKLEVEEAAASDPSSDIRNSIKLIRASLSKAKLGDETASSRITSELDAIERALSRASKFSLL